MGGSNISIWGILGLDGPTDDKSAIKKAYAKLLKVTRPDDDLTAFVQLRDAYERALKYAPAQEILFDDNDRPSPKIEFAGGEKVIDIDLEAFPETDPEYDFVENSTHMGEDETVEFDPENDLQQRISNEIQALMTDGDVHLAPDNWRSFFENSDYYSIDAEMILERLVREAILVHYGFYTRDGVFGNISSAKYEASSRFMSEAGARFNSERNTTRFGTFLFDKFEWHLPERVGFEQYYKIEWLRQKLDVINRSRSDLGYEIDEEDPIKDGIDETWFVVLASLCLTGLFIYWKFIS